MTNKEFTESNFYRNYNDRYFTESACTLALLPHIPSEIEYVWEPAVGRGDMAIPLINFGYQVHGSDIDTKDVDANLCPIFDYNFLTGLEDGSFWLPENTQAIITNPPFGTLAEEFVRRSLSYESIRYHAFLLRSSWKHAKRRTDLFTKQPFAYEIALTWRPRWDWWYRDKPEAGPIHNYSWFIWDRDWRKPCTTFWENKRGN